MIRITRQADYGIVLMTRMAAAPDQIFNAPDLAADTRLPQPMVSKILKGLAREGLLASHRGAKGGYSLERLPADISVAEIITAIDGPIAITECIDNSPGECSQESFCAVRGNWQRINEAIRGALHAITLAEMTHSIPRTIVTLGDRGRRPADQPVAGTQLESR